MPAARMNNADIGISAQTFLESAADRDFINTLLVGNLTENGTAAQADGELLQSGERKFKIPRQQPTYYRSFTKSNRQVCGGKSGYFWIASFSCRRSSSLTANRFNEGDKL